MKYGLIGEKLGHSYSPKIHKLLGGYEYELKEIPEAELKDFFERKDFFGINVTIPYKEKAIKHLDFVEDKAREIGAVNTIVNKGGVLYGYNTDYYGLKYLLEKNEIEVKGKKVAILGSGGASKMAQVLLNDLGAKCVIVVSRRGEYNYDNQQKYSDSEIIINASPVGMYERSGECLVNLSLFSNLQAVVDMVYNPFVTELMFRAKEVGVKSVNGLTMLVAQGLKASELFFEKEIDKTKIEIIKGEIERELKNIVFIGMPGSGKSTFAKMLATKLNKVFVDLDLEFAKVYGITPSECINTLGEQTFREKESKLLIEVCKKTALIISTGGGAILSKENRKAIKSNSRCIYLKRAIFELSRRDRPLSKDDDALIKMFEKRNPIYLELADYIVENDGDVNFVFNKIMEVIG